ncbi:effector-associated domain 2-containing protein [Streptomyces phaeofaciens]|uniref:effector-associated domain 2-containing protein n=1 Tax=Streptomyces phaeofaciens TaxID=68254 RepID=UPI001E44AAF3|nr:caspase family protein [Streptomyces phaeofaciens]
MIVGIEAYEAGPTWDLPGPARDAVAFRRLLEAAGVPASQLRLHLAPLRPPVPGTEYLPADQATLRRALVRDLPRTPGDILWVWWGGHGVLDRAGHSRLFCADATTGDKVSIDLESALTRYTSDAVPGFTQQLWIVDACETFEEALAFRDPLPADTLPAGRRTLAHRQVLLRAAGRGRQAVNDPVRATGLFSDVLLSLLTDCSSVLPALPDPEELFGAVRRRIAALRAEGRTLQHPEIQLRSPGRTETLAAADVQAPTERPMSPLARAVDALVAYPLMADPVERQAVVAVLGTNVIGTLPRHNKPRTDMTGILTALVRRAPDALWELYDAVLSVDGDPGRKAELASALRELGHVRKPPEGPEHDVR